MERITRAVFRDLVRSGQPIPASARIVDALPHATVRELSRERREIEFVLSTGAVDRFGDVVDPRGWQLDAFRRNPVVLWAHQYDELPVAQALWVRVDQASGALVSRARFPRGLSPLSDTVWRFYDEGLLTGVSVGFRPIKWAYNAERGGVDYLEQELLEYSAVPVPANPEALARRVVVERGAVPSDVSDELAPEDTPWEAPTLGDFTDGAWEDLTAAERRRIAGHFAWAASMPPERFEDLTLPHHRPSDGAVVWRGVAAAAARLDQTDLPSEDLARVRAHLARHYRQFDRQPPWEQDASASWQLAVLLAEREGED